MTPYIAKNRKKKIRNIKKSALVKYELARRGQCLSTIAKDLSISNSAVSRAINGLSKISRVDNWIVENLGLQMQQEGAFN